MASLMGSIPTHHYDMQTNNEVSEARMDLVFKVCEYLIRRLALYSNNITYIKRESNNHTDESREFRNILITTEGWSTLFDAEPLAHGRRISSCLFDIVSSVNEFWRGCAEDNFTRLHTTCQARPGQPRHLLQRHFLFFKHLFAYLDYIGSVVQRVSFADYDEFEELSYFLTVLVATQFLVGDLLDLGTTPVGRSRTKLRNYDTVLYNSVEECVVLMGIVHNMWRDARGLLMTECLLPDEPCARGDFFVLERKTAG